MASGRSTCCSWNFLSMLTLDDFRWLTNWSSEDRKDWTSGLEVPSCTEPHVWTQNRGSSNETGGKLS